MRFRHVDPTAVIAFLSDNRSAILMREWDRERAAGGIAGMLRMSRPQAAQGARPGEISDVEFIAGRHAPSDIGVVLRFFFHIGSSSDQPVLPLIEAVAHVENRGLAGEFLLAGHPDGGLVSVSRERLPFQQGLDPITWWGP
jgi:hypothetical protein